MWNVKFYHKLRYYMFLFKQRQVNKQNKTTLLLKGLKPLNYLFGGETANQFHTAHAC